MTPPDNQPALVYRKDYRTPDYLIDQTHLTLDIQPDCTQVSSRLIIRRNIDTAASSEQKETLPPLVLDGVNLELISLAINGKALTESDYHVDKTSLTITNVPASFTLECVVIIHPKDNTTLVGLYQTQGLYCTQCEPQGFRHITFYLDRPDVLSEFYVTLIADKALYPVLLANGNLLEQGDVECVSGSSQPHRAWATWHDPFKKPSYLFAMVAGKLRVIEDTFVTRSQREVTLRIFAENPSDLAKCHQAMQVAKQAMAWDEKHYGREYDLELFMIVVIADFNVGAMENKGLNIYRADWFMIDPQTATDASLQNMTETIAHEYCHNWSGNRVTCRDWFQLSLKEGFTTYRGQQFCHDTYSSAARRVGETLFIRNTQFAEDSSPLAHPVRPDAYRAIWNFYTPTVYQKGAEVVRMLNTLLGPKNYRKGCDLFFDRHDGQATTADDFIAALQEVSGRDLSQFKLWYSQTGTPRVAVRGEYNSERKQFTVSVQQNATPPLQFPMSISLLGQQGPMPLRLPGNENADQYSIVLDITKGEQTFVFEQVSEAPVPSLFRDFSAPVKYTYHYSFNDLLRLLQKEPSGYCRWEASQLVWLAVIKQTLQNKTVGDDIEIPAAVITYYQDLLTQTQIDPELDQALIAQQLTLPSVAYLIAMDELTGSIDIPAICRARQAVKQSLALRLKATFEIIYGVMLTKPPEPVSITAIAMAQRALRNIVLGYLVESEETVWLEHCYQQLQTANNMTDTIAALTCLVNSPASCAISLKQQALDAFYDRWQHQPFVLDQWLAVQARCPLPDTLSTVKTLLKHPAFDITSPSRVNALIGNFCNQNAENFHHEAGSGYQFLIDQIIVLNDINPQVASRTLSRSPLINWKRYDDHRQNLMKMQLQRLQSLPTLSNEVFEVVDKCLMATKTRKTG